MKSRLIILIISIYMLSCNGGNKQEIYLKNNSNSDIYYCVHRNEIPDTSDIKSIRPWTQEMIKNHHKHLVFESKKDSIKNAFGLQTAYLIRKNNSAIIFSSKGAKVFNNKITIRDQIKYEYDGKMYISTILYDTLNRFTNEEIIKDKLYYTLEPLTEQSVITDITTLIFKKQ